MPNVGVPELAIVLIIALIVFGPKRLPELGRSLGKGIREFRGSLSGEGDDEPEPSREPAPLDREIQPPPPTDQAEQASSDQAEQTEDGETVVHDRN